MSDNFIEMTMEEWETTYKPIYNHIDSNASFQDESGNGIMFETYGDEYEFVKSQPPANIWMYGSGDDGGTYIWNGWGFVNRLGYFITEVPCPDGLTIQVQVGEPDLTCDFCGDIIEQDETHKCEGINE
ncbi:MAG: hypothetical protein AN484_00825 [Aphanizomenon flos-aquae WA102]|uniref:Uncharacterized protein n=1 Tax=Aphanizomenon flos-aquae WA102 TaxID=1710896 RepID=A0A1B7X833_APHFL|nr:MAG: hypothetical protein AN484_00825 [Aphanizomenon flos-aquae WA102]